MNKNHSSAQHAKTLFVKAVTKLQNGDALGARQGLIKVAKLIPDSAVVWYNLGLSYQHLNQHQLAIKAYQKSLKITPHQVDGWVNLGISQKELGLQPKALKSAAKALQLDPANARALNLSGSIAAEQDDDDNARLALEQSIRANPKNIDAKINLATLELKHGKHDQATHIVDALLQQHPDDFSVNVLKTNILLSEKKYEEASLIILKLKEQAPNTEETLRLNLSLKEAIRDHFGVISVAEKLLDQLPEDAAIWNSLGSAYFQLDSIKNAKRCYEKAIALDPKHAEYENNVGLAYASLGNKESAEQHYRRSIELDPGHAEAYRNIATMKRFKSMDDPDAEKIKSLWEQKDLDDLSAIKASFALGKVYDDCGLYEQAFEAYTRGNKLKFKESGVDLDTFFAHIDRIPSILDRLPTETSGADSSPTPVFILGMPRSGTTLVEQIITRHSEVAGCGELPCIERAINRLEKRAEPMRVYPNDFWGVSQRELESEAREYLTWVKRLHKIDTPYFTDKMPFNFVHIWLIHAIFPDAPIIHCKRHPLDVITSNYFQLYGSDISFVYQLEALTTYYIRYHRIMTHWQRLLGTKLYTVQYENLVSNPEPETRQLIAAIGLDWEESCLEHKSSATAVRTASIWQVRQGIYTRSKERWRNYESHYKGVIAMLAAEGILDQEGMQLDG